jgi:N-acetylglucosamine-6-phosphate deacetylase
MAVLTATRVVTPDGVIGPAAVEVEDGHIIRVGPTGGEVPDRVLVPGLVDLQVNGIDDVDVASAEGADWDVLDRHLLAQGVTTWCPTLVTAPLERYARPLARIAEAAARPGPRPAIAGAHLEGPFLGGRPGAHPTDLIIPPDRGWLDDLDGTVALVTIAPEPDGALDAIAALAGRGVLVSLGHSAATVEQATAGIDAGARLVTHGFNGMSGLDHRAPGMVGAFLTDDRVSVSLIADLVHVHPAALAVAFRCKPVDRVVLVTDSVAWRRGQVGTIELVHDGRAPRLPDGTLAGSALALDQAVANVVATCGVALEHAIDAASANPARLLGLDDRGAIVEGRRADLVALDPDTLRATATWIGGEQAHGPS